MKAIFICLLFVFANPVKSSFTNFNDLLIGRTALENKIDKKTCTFKGFKLYGKIKFVESFPDIKIKFVESFADIHVKFVSSFPDDCGKWQIVESFPDIKVQVVESFPDITVKIVESFPGVQ